MNQSIAQAASFLIARSAVALRDAEKPMSKVADKHVRATLDELHTAILYQHNAIQELLKEFGEGAGK